jgi:hypothetical protein
MRTNVCKCVHFSHAHAKASTMRTRRHTRMQKCSHQQELTVIHVAICKCLLAFAIAVAIVVFALLTPCTNQQSGVHRRHACARRHTHTHTHTHRPRATLNGRVPRTKWHARCTGSRRRAPRSGRRERKSECPCPAFCRRPTRPRSCARVRARRWRVSAEWLHARGVLQRSSSQTARTVNGHKSRRNTCCHRSRQTCPCRASCPPAIRPRTGRHRAT